MSSKAILDELKERLTDAYEEKEAELGEPIRELERVVLLKVVDNKWMDHIDNMDRLKDGIGLRAYGQKDPVVQYRMEGGQMFDEMVASIQLDVAKIMLRISKMQKTAQRENSVNIVSTGFDDSAVKEINNGTNVNAVKSASESKPEPIRNSSPKVGRNDPCPCGSGKKYKNCCGRNQ